MPSNDLSDTIRENAQGPSEARGDQGAMRQHDLADQIMADRYLASKTAADSARRGLSMIKLSPPGTV